ncbi:MAG: RNA 2',3'-cyclic phosphodiesterase [Elusimicrobia bacterium HGW-Elusimicrobia-2]|nr:MAG: RNA 2',3'-cyclic phosphodiesterase [Elusimicrobia bacterium HGW-Elusimicrobia-2]
MTEPTPELNKTPVRYFIAVKLSDEAKKEIRNVFGQVSANINGRIVKDDGLHLTLKFLGELSEEKIETAKKIISGACSEFPLFQVSLGKTGSFPAKKPKVLWAGVRKGRDELAAISKFVSGRAKDSLGIPKDSKEFIPHITLCRLSGKNVPEDFYSLRFIASFRAAKLFLIRSELHLSGAVYRDVFSAEFKTNNS